MLLNPTKGRIIAAKEEVVIEWQTYMIKPDTCHLTCAIGVEHTGTGENSRACSAVTLAVSVVVDTCGGCVDDQISTQQYSSFNNIDPHTDNR